MRFTLTGHAKRVLEERGIPIEWVQRALDAPEHRKPDPADLALELYYRRISEHGGRVLRVVANITVDPVRVVSCILLS